MFDPIIAIVQFMINAFLHVWPYLLITIPLAVAVQMSGAAKYINRAFAAQPLVAIFLATAVGAFSPFCSCGVIPVVATLLIGGVPLAPVMAFWIASPSMDPEVFFLSVATIGWELAVWRLISTLLLSLSAGFITHFVVQQGWLGAEILRTRKPSSVQGYGALLKEGWQSFKRRLTVSPVLGFTAGNTPLATETACCHSSAEITLTNSWQPLAVASVPSSSCDSSGCGPSSTPAAESSCSLKPASFRQRLLNETWSASLMVAKFMALAFFLEALIILYIPSEWIAGLLGQQNQWAILMAALIGVPVYTTELTALPMVSGLLAQGMDPGAALAFLIAGPTTTLPAMAAVWGLTTRRVFFLYLSFVLVGAIVFGYLYDLAGRLIG
ncbi:MAG: permease [Anaerolineae bacterium]|nr:permease [Anaerolineae bacterium]